MTWDLAPAGPGQETCGARVGRYGWCDLPKDHPAPIPGWLHVESVSSGEPVTEPGKELVGPLPTVAFYGGPWRGLRRYHDDRARVAYDVPRNTMDPRFRACTDHHVACDCREAEQAENLNEHRLEWAHLRETARRALVGHQVDYPYGLRDHERYDFPLCLCSGCVIERTSHNLLASDVVDHRTGRVIPLPPHPSEDVPF